MPLSWNEIKSRALAFSRKWEGESSERAEAQSFWNDFFGVFGIERRRVAVFEKQVKLVRAGEHLKRGRIDAFWKGMLLIEHKSADQDLDRAFAQAADYFEGLPQRDLPRYIVVSDFARFRLYDLEDDTEVEFRLADLHKRVKHFGFIAGYRTQEIKPQDPVNIKAAEEMGRLHDLLKASGYSGHALELLLVRLLFCLFADDTGIFQPAQAFRAWLDERTAADGSDLGPQLAQLFQVLNQTEEGRPKTLDEQLRAFPYVNGKLFEEPLPLASFDAKMRDTLLDCCTLDWGAISPAIFGALFQSIMDDKARRNLGAHYTSEENILKLIKPLFLDGLWAEFERVKGNKNRLFDFLKKLRALNFFDPACGCGNFLVISYRELRTLELEVLRAAVGIGQQFVDVFGLVRIDVDQFYGIEIEEFPAQIAQVALWLVDHQMNVRVSEEFGLYFARIPLKTTPHIVNGNALKLDWADVVPPERLSYILGNPPFVGKTWQTPAQREDMASVCSGIPNAGLLDLVCGWYVKAIRYIAGTNIDCAFVSTNSITQGEQVGVLWRYLLPLGIKINFAHRSFQWTNEARGQATVQCIIIGFGLRDRTSKVLFQYETPRADPHAVSAAHINPYLVDAPDVLLPKRSSPLSSEAPAMRYGSKPADGGHLIMSDAERHELERTEPQALKWIRPYFGADELLYGTKRWCLWLRELEPHQLRGLPHVVERVKLVKSFRTESKDANTRRWASYPTLFQTNRQPTSAYVALPEVSSENRSYLPIAYLPPDAIASNKIYTVERAGLYHFGVLISHAHHAWMAYTSGRLESRYQYSESLTYNNFPWPEAPTQVQKQKIEAAAQGVLDARAEFPDASLANLYDPLTMPPVLVRAHHKLDAAVDAAYGKRNFRNDAERVAFLFELYRKYTSLLPAGGMPAKRASRKKRPA